MVMAGSQEEEKERQWFFVHFPQHQLQQRDSMKS